MAAGYLLKLLSDEKKGIFQVKKSSTEWRASQKLRGLAMKGGELWKEMGEEEAVSQLTKLRQSMTSEEGGMIQVMVDLVVFGAKEEEEGESERDAEQKRRREEQEQEKKEERAQ
eukprot:647778-Rhodomonas_salina.1